MVWENLCWIGTPAHWCNGLRRIYSELEIGVFCNDNDDNDTCMTRAAEKGDERDGRPKNLASDYSGFIVTLACRISVCTHDLFNSWTQMQTSNTELLNNSHRFFSLLFPRLLNKNKYTLTQRKGRVTVSRDNHGRSGLGGLARERGGGFLHDDNDDDTYIRPSGIAALGLTKACQSHENRIETVNFTISTNLKWHKQTSQATNKCRLRAAVMHYAKRTWRAQLCLEQLGFFLNIHKCVREPLSIIWRNSDSNTGKVPETWQSWVERATPHLGFEQQLYTVVAWASPCWKRVNCFQSPDSRRFSSSGRKDPVSSSWFTPSSRMTSQFSSNICKKCKLST